MSKINEANELHLMPLVNILPILIVLSITKIIYSHKFMMEKVFNINSLLSKCIYKVYIEYKHIFHSQYFSYFIEMISCE